MTTFRTIGSRNALYQEWHALLANRSKRHRSASFLVQGVRPITLALDHGWPIRTVLFDAQRPLSGWARDVLDRVDAEIVGMTSELLGELGEKTGGAPELVLVAGIPADDLTRIQPSTSFLGVVFDRPTNPGNIGSVIRSLDAFGGGGMIVTGHAADPYDPRSVRASTGSLFAVPTVRAPSHTEVVEWAALVQREGVPLTIVGTDEHGERDLADHDFRGPTLVVVGNETAGLSAAWRDACDVMVRIPMRGSASSLNAANAASVVLYEAVRQRRPDRGDA